MRFVAVFALIACGGSVPAAGPDTTPTTVTLKWDAVRPAACGQEHVICSAKYVVEADYAPHVVDYYYPQCRVAHSVNAYAIDCTGFSCGSTPASGCPGWNYKCDKMWLADDDCHWSLP